MTSEITPLCSYTYSILRDLPLDSNVYCKKRKLDKNEIIKQV